MGVASRVKGIEGEKAVIALLQPVVDACYVKAGFSTIPQLQRNLSQCRDGGADLTGLAWLAIEVKDCAKADMGRWWVQTVRQSEAIERRGQRCVAVLCYRVARSEWRVRFPAHVVAVQLMPLLTAPMVVDVDIRDFARWLSQSITSRLRDGVV